MIGLDKNGIAQRIAQEVQDGYYVNLGIGIPTLVANFVRKDIEVEFQSENGILGMGHYSSKAKTIFERGSTSMFSLIRVKNSKTMIKFKRRSQ